MLIDMLVKCNIALGTKLLVSLVCNSFDNFSGFFDKVNQIEYDNSDVVLTLSGWRNSNP